MDNCPKCEKDLRPGAVRCDCGWQLPALARGVAPTTVAEIREAYQNSDAYRKKFPGHISEAMKKIPEREPGEEG